MDSNMYLYEKAREAHHQDLQREMTTNRWSAHLPRHPVNRRAVGSLGLLLLQLGSWLKQFEHSHSVLDEPF
jgi:hypothetical protein